MKPNLLFGNRVAMAQKDENQHVKDAAKLVVNAWNTDESAVASLQSYCLDNDMDFTWEFHSTVAAHAKQIWCNQIPS